MGAPQKFKKAQIEQALIDNRGLINPVARSLGCSPQTIHNYLDRYPDLVRVRELQHDRLIDAAEVRIIEAVEKKGEPWAVLFVLKTLGRNRGYVERTEQEVSGKDGGAIPHHHTLEMGGFTNDELRTIVERATGRGGTGAGTP